MPPFLFVLSISLLSKNFDVLIFDFAVLAHFSFMGLLNQPMLCLPVCFFESNFLDLCHDYTVLLKRLSNIYIFLFGIYIEFFFRVLCQNQTIFIPFSSFFTFVSYLVIAITTRYRSACGLHRYCYI